MLFLIAALVTAALLVLIAFNLASWGSVRLERFREPTWVLHGVLGLAGLWTWRFHRPAFRATWARSCAWLGHRGATWGILLTMLGIYELSAITHHLAFETFSHDFSMLDEALHRTHEGQFMYSPVLGRNLFTEHLSPVLLILVPLHAVFDSPWLLVLLQPLILWSSSLLVMKLLEDHGFSRAVINFLVLLYLNHPVMVSTLEYGFHMECFWPVALFTLYRCFIRRQWVGAVMALALSLGIKEDAGLYLAGTGLYLWVAFRAWIAGGAVFVIGSAATFLALHLLSGSSPSGSTYMFIERWSEWGKGPFDIAWAWLSHPVDVLTDMMREPMPRYLACLGFLPLARPSTLLLFVAPWVVNTTSNHPGQASLSLYYGMPVFAFACVATLAALAALRQRQSERLRPLVIVLSLLALTLNVAHFTFPHIPRQRGDVLQQLPRRGSVQASSCFFPVLGYDTDKTLLRADATASADFLLVRTAGGTWPLSGDQARAFIKRALANGYRVYYQSPGFVFLSKAASFPVGEQ